MSRGQFDEYFSPITEINAPIKGKGDYTVGKGGLYLGNMYAAKNHTLLKEKGIGCVVTVIDIKLSNLVPEIIKHLIIPANDTVDQDMRQYFEKTNQFIEKNLENTNVLIHCITGTSSSTTIIMAYLMNKNRWNYQKTLSFVREKRPIVAPNSGFIAQLIQYQQFLRNAK